MLVVHRIEKREGEEEKEARHGRREVDISKELFAAPPHTWKRSHILTQRLHYKYAQVRYNRRSVASG